MDDVSLEKLLRDLESDRVERKESAANTDERWSERIPREYRTAVLDRRTGHSDPLNKDVHCLALVKHHRSLMALAQEARKPMFHLRPADGAIGAHADAVHAAYKDFRALAVTIADRTGPTLPAVGA